MVTRLLAALDRAEFSILGAVYLGPGRIVHLRPAAYLALMAAGAVWCFLAYLVAARVWLAGKGAAPTTAAPGTERRLFLGALTLFLMLGAWVTLSYPPTSDEPHYLMLAESLVMDRDIDLANQYAHADQLKFYPSATIDPHVVITRDGRWYAQHTIGLPLLVLPGYAIAGRWGVLALLALVAAALPVLLFRLARGAGVPALPAGVTAALLAGTSPLLFSSTLMFPDTAAAVLTAAGLTTTASVWIPAACAAAMPWLHPRFALLCAGLLAVHLTEQRRRDAILLAWAGFALFSGAAFLLVYHGDALVAALNVLTEQYPAHIEDLGKATVTGNMGLRYLPAGLMGKLLDRDFGVIPFAPWLLVAIPGAFVAWRRRGFPHRRLVLGGGLYALVTVLYRNWAGSAFPGRTMVPLLPFAAPYLAAGIGWARTTPARHAILNILVALSLATALALTACPVLRYTSGRDWMAAKTGRAWHAAPFSWFPHVALRPAPK